MQKESILTFNLETTAEKYLSVREVSEALGIDYSTARRWLADGRLPGDRVANKVFGRASEIIEIAKTLEGCISVAETAERINRAERTVNHLIVVTKQIKARKFMRRWYVDQESVDKYLKNREEKELKEPESLAPSPPQSPQ